MTRQQLIDRIASNHPDVKKEEVGEIVRQMFHTIAAELAAGKSIHIAGFGKFEVKRRAARKMRNPWSGQSMVAPAKNTPVFRAGKSLKKAVNGEPAETQEDI